MTDHYASGNWNVKAGQEKEFVQKWTEFVTWSRSTQPAMLEASLLHDLTAPGHYVSMSGWTDAAARAHWRESPEFVERFGACVALCEDATGSEYDRVLTV
jgi:heme-degrading monooxygenase HmoA